LSGNPERLNVRTPPKYSKGCFADMPTEIQDQDRGPSPSETYGLPGWGCPR
jgi:hypothetical protein